MVGGPYKALIELNRSHRLGPGILDRLIVGSFNGHGNLNRFMIPYLGKKIRQKQLSLTALATC